MSTAVHCKYHPAVDAEYSCFACKAPMCDSCARSREDGTIVCSQCLLAGKQQSREFDLAPVAMETPPPVARPTGPMCSTHPEVPAVALCAQCRLPICPTCDFAFPGGVHLCPKCATNPKQKLSSSRKNMAMASIILGGITMGATIFQILIQNLVGFSREIIPLLGCFVMLYLVAGITGFFLGISSFRRNSHNPGYLWLGPILSGLVSILWILLIVIGMMRHGGE